MEADGYHPVIATAWRSPDDQLKAYEAGNSKLRWGLHCATANGKPDSLAVDIVDATLGWGAPKAFWLSLARHALDLGLEPGASWGLSGAQRKALTRGGADAVLGWDPAHVQCVSSSIPSSRVRNGWRPTLRSPADDGIMVVMGGKRLGVTAELRNGRVWAPARELAAMLESAISYSGGKLYVLQDGSRIPVPCELREGTAWAPVADVAHAAGASAAWDAAERIVTLHK
jgi:hypothetical protein